MGIEFRQLVAPIGVQLELTPFCTNNCFLCYNHWRGEDLIKEKVMSTADFLRVVDILHAAKVFYVTLTGGEPLFVGSVFREVLKKLSHYGIYCDLNSNLVEVDKESIHVMRECGLISILTSFHSFREDLHDSITGHEGSFKKTLDNIKRLAQLGFSINVNMVVTKLNVKDVYDTCHLLKKAGIKSFNATRFQVPVRDVDFSSLQLTKEETKKIVEQLMSAEEDMDIKVGSVIPYPFCFLAEDPKSLFLSKRTCGAGVVIASIEYSGLVRACPTSGTSYGNILIDGLAKCWKNMSLWREGLCIPSECFGCHYVAICKGGCRAEGIKQNKINQPDSLMGSPISKPIKGFRFSKELSYKIEDKFALCKEMKYREETFGYTVIGCDPTSPAFVSEIVLVTLLKLKNRPFIQIKDFISEWGVEIPEIKALLSCLEEKKIITRLTQKGGDEYE